MVYLRLPFGHDINKSWELDRHFVWRHSVIVLYKIFYTVLLQTVSIQNVCLATMICLYRICLYKLKVQPVHKKV